jgi:diamine N-acetyltransferase
MEISFEEVTFENLDEYCDLDANDNGKFVATNSYSVAQSKFNKNFIVKGIRCSDEEVGFVMYEINETRKEMYIYRFMIDKEHQKKGYGKMALEELKKIGEESDCKLIKLSTSEENKRGIKVYEASGFIDKHEKHYGEEVFEYLIKRSDI